MHINLDDPPHPLLSSLTQHRAYLLKKKKICFLFRSHYLLIYGGTDGSYIKGTMRNHTAVKLCMPNLIL